MFLTIDYAGRVVKRKMHKVDFFFFDILFYLCKVNLTVTVFFTVTNFVTHLHIGDEMGRPRILTDRIFERICQRIEEGESLRAICSEDGYPAARIVHTHLATSVEYQRRYVRARAIQAESFADEIIDVARGNKDHNDKKVLVDSLKWTAAKLLPSRWGEKQTLQVSGPDGEAIHTKVDWVVVKPDNDIKS